MRAGSGSSSPHRAPSSWARSTLPFEKRVKRLHAMNTLPRQTQPATAPIPRRHTPSRAGYATYRSCLRWEFGFTCAFCLLHEADLVEEGVQGTGLTTIEHHVAQSADLTLVDTYENCFYACRYC